MVDKDDLRDQLTRAFENAEYPVENAMDLVPALPDGPSTRFESGDFSMTAVELNMKLPGGDFPYDSVDALVEDILNSLEEEGFI
jgi:hypothetical protein